MSSGSRTPPPIGVTVSVWETMATSGPSVTTNDTSASVSPEPERSYWSLTHEPTKSGSFGGTSRGRL